MAILDVECLSLKRNWPSRWFNYIFRWADDSIVNSNRWSTMVFGANKRSKSYLGFARMSFVITYVDWSLARGSVMSIPVHWWHIVCHSLFDNDIKCKKENTKYAKNVNKRKKKPLDFLRRQWEYSYIQKIYKDYLRNYVHIIKNILFPIENYVRKD